MRTYPYKLITDGNISANSATSGYVSSSAHPIEYTYGFSIEASFKGSNPEGILSLHSSNDGTNFSLVRQTEVLPNGSSGTFMWNYGRMVNYDYIFVDFAATSASSGVLNCLFFSKGS